MRVALAILCLVITGCIVPTYAVDLTSELSSSGVPAKQKFQFQETVFVDYHNGGKIKDILQGKNITVNISSDSSDPQILQLMNTLNTNLVRDQHSLVKINDLDVVYSATLQGGSQAATIDYKLVLVPTIINYVMAKNPDGQTVIDASWIGMSVNSPILISSQYGQIDINRPSGFLQTVVPDLYAVVKPSDSAGILDLSFVDSSSLLKQSPDQWQHLFDPAYIIHETSTWGYNGSKVPISTFTIGQSSIGQQLKDIVNKEDFTLDKDYQIQTVQHASSATIQIDGIAKLQGGEGNLVFVTTPINSTSEPMPSSNLSVQVIYAMAGLGGVVAAGILYWSNRKMKQALLKKDSNVPSPVTYEERKHWADRFEK